AAQAAERSSADIEEVVKQISEGKAGATDIAALDVNRLFLNDTIQVDKFFQGLQKVISTPLSLTLPEAERILNFCSKWVELASKENFEKARAAIDRIIDK